MLFGKEGCEGLSVVRMIRHELVRSPAAYEFLSEAEYLLRIGTDVRVANQIYWQEIFFRSHFAAVTSLIRNLSWISGMTSSVAHSQYLPFAACARSLLESTVDSWSTLSQIPKTLLGENKYMIQRALDGSFDTVLLNKDLENYLIHFSHGRKIEKNEKDLFPQEHHAKAPWEYLKDYKLSGGSQLVVDFYAELCQLVHPAMDSVFYVAEVLVEKELTTVKVPVESDRKLIRSTLSRKKHEFREILKLAIGPPVKVLKALDEFGLNAIHLPILKEINV